MAFAIVLIMTPAAYHRQTSQREVTAKFLRVSTRLVLCSLPLLAVSLCTEFLYISRVIVNSQVAAIVTAALVAAFAILWFVLPRAHRLQEIRRGAREPKSR